MTTPILVRFARTSANDASGLDIKSTLPLIRILTCERRPKCSKTAVGNDRAKWSDPFCPRQQVCQKKQYQKISNSPCICALFGLKSLKIKRTLWYLKVDVYAAGGKRYRQRSYGDRSISEHRLPIQKQARSHVESGLEIHKRATDEPDAPMAVALGSRERPGKKKTVKMHLRRIWIN